MSFADLPASPVPAYQNLDEFGRLWDLVASRPHANVLEIGSLYGGTLWWWSFLPNVERLVSIDMVTDWDQIRPEVLEARANWPEWFPSAEIHEGNSHDPAMVESVGGLFDFIFIDGDHTYDGVRADWLAWSPHVRPGGLVAFHDTWPNGDTIEPGVVRWVDELRHHRPSIEWTNPDGVGICAFVL